MDGKEFFAPINADIVKKYYAWGHQKKNLLELKTQKGGLDKKRKKKEKERFKVKTQKGSLNHKNEMKNEKKNERSSWKPERVTWQRKGYLDWKPERAV